MTPLAENIQRTNTILYCANWAEVVAFYRDQLVLPVAWQNEWLVEFQLTSDSFVSVADARRATVGATTGQGLTLTWRVVNVAEVWTALQARGVHPNPTPLQEKWGARLFYIFDPAGNRVEFWE